MIPRKKAVWGRTQAPPPMAKKGKEKKKKIARKILCPSDYVLELHGDEEEALEVEDVIQMEENNVKP